MVKIGAHVSAAVSLEKSLEKADTIGAECTQIFISPPQQWTQTVHDTQEIEKYKDLQSKTNIGPNFIHGTYLINLGTQNPENLQKSINWLVYALNLADKLKMAGVIFHLGSHKGVGFKAILPQIVDSIKKVLIVSPKNTQLILETAAGSGNIIGDKFFELGQILKKVNDPRLKICLDTQHVFAAGYDIKSSNGLDEVLDEFEKEIGLSNLLVMHSSDSKVEFGSNKDRHENIGEGFIGIEGFKNIINHPKLKDVPIILEVPGFSGGGPDKENIILLKSLRRS